MAPFNKDTPNKKLEVIFYVENDRGNTVTLLDKKRPPIYTSSDTKPGEHHVIIRLKGLSAGECFLEVDTPTQLPHQAL